MSWKGESHYRVGGNKHTITIPYVVHFDSKFPFKAGDILEVNIEGDTLMIRKDKLKGKIRYFVRGTKRTITVPHLVHDNSQFPFKTGDRLEVKIENTLRIRRLPDHFDSKE